MLIKYCPNCGCGLVNLEFSKCANCKRDYPYTRLTLQELELKRDELKGAIEHLKSLVNLKERQYANIIDKIIYMDYEGGMSNGT